jgi:membrane-associated phospholipid phosphatase
LIRSATVVAGRPIDVQRAWRALGLVAALFVVVLACGIVLGVLVTGPLGPATSRDVDVPIARFIAAHFGSADDGPLIAISALGSLPVALSVALIAGVAFARLGGSVLPLLQCAGAVLGAALITIVVRLVVTRPRGYGPLKGFPSGHVLLAVAVFGVLAAIVVRSPLPRALRWVTASALVTIAAAVACARVLILDHVLSDVLASVALGAAWTVVLVTVLTSDAVLRRRGEEPNRRI